MGEDDLPLSLPPSLSHTLTHYLSLSHTLPLSFIVPLPLSHSSYLLILTFVIRFPSSLNFPLLSLLLCRSFKPKPPHAHTHTHTATPKHACHPVITSQISRLVVGRQLQLRQQQSGCEVLVECNMKKKPLTLHTHTHTHTLSHAFTHQTVKSAEGSVLKLSEKLRSCIYLLKKVPTHAHTHVHTLLY